MHAEARPETLSCRGPGRTRLPKSALDALALVRSYSVFLHSRSRRGYLTALHSCGDNTDMDFGRILITDSACPLNALRFTVVASATWPSGVRESPSSGPKLLPNPPRTKLHVTRTGHASCDRCALFVGSLVPDRLECLSPYSTPCARLRHEGTLGFE